MNVVFLDYDGVVNTPMWTHDGTHVTFNFPADGSVNNFQAVQWLSEFCQKYGYDIVVSSTWRIRDNYQECLRNGGLRDGISILGCTPVLHGWDRGAEIKQWLDNHQKVENYVVLDDEWFRDFQELHHHIIQCDSRTGVTERVYDELSSAHRMGVFSTT